MHVIGIDPGINGALVISWANHGFISPIEAIDMPVFNRPRQKKKEIDPYALFTLFSRFDQENTSVFLEQVHSSPQQGVTSAFNFGQGFGLLRGLLVGCGLMIHPVRPQEWKAYHGLLKTEKDAARQLCFEKYSSFSDRFLLRKKDVDRADALLIAEYGFRKVVCSSHQRMGV